MCETKEVDEALKDFTSNCYTPWQGKCGRKCFEYEESSNCCFDNQGVRVSEEAQRYEIGGKTMGRSL